MTVNGVRSAGYWIVGLTSLVSSLIYNCVTCRKERASAQIQKMADFPCDRLEPSPPFTHVGLDFFGPFPIREGRRELKRYGVMFTCLASRAVHLETANSLNSSSFINALRRFLSLRGPIRTLRCDRGTNFMGGIRQLQESIDQIEDEMIKTFLLDHSCDYIVNVPNASHQGGVWERQIRTARNYSVPYSTLRAVKIMTRVSALSYMKSLTLSIVAHLLWKILVIPFHPFRSRPTTYWP